MDKTMLLDDVPVRIIRRDGERVLVVQATYPFPRWVDASELTMRPPAAFVAAPF